MRCYRGAATILPTTAAGIGALAVYGPIHYQELPELFMDFIASLTGKSPSTTGAGSEGALTKGPFNALLPILDLNAALMSYLLSGYEGFSTAAGYVGPKYKVAHDVSLIVPEVWSRMYLKERSPKWLIAEGYLEPLHDFEEDGQLVPASRLGYRITSKFVETFFGRIFAEPRSVFTEEMLRPELQGREDYLDGIRNIAETQKSVALSYFEDGGIDVAIPPLKALLHIMAYGHYEGKTIHDPEIRGFLIGEMCCREPTGTGSVSSQRKTFVSVSSTSISFASGISLSARTTKRRRNAFVSRSDWFRQEPPLRHSWMMRNPTSTAFGER